MKKGLVRFLAAAITLCCLVLPALAGDFRNVVVFGDSLSDSGNAYGVSARMSADPPYPPAPYWEGRFSDGPVWVEYLEKYLGIQGVFCNFAHAGATTGTGNVGGEPTGYTTQVQDYLGLSAAAAYYPTAFPQPDETLFVIWIGGNDFLGGVTDPLTAIGGAVLNIKNGMNRLIDAGAAKFLVVNLPDLGRVPGVNADAAAATPATQLSVAVNQTLEAMLQGLEAANPALEIERLDVFTLMAEIIADSAALGYTNVTDAQFGSRKDGSVAEGTYFFWDDIHPTTKTHRIVANAAASVLECGSCTGGLPQIGADLRIVVPYAELGTDAYGFRLDFCANPAADPDGMYWKLDPASLTTK